MPVQTPMKPSMKETFSRFAVLAWALSASINPVWAADAAPAGVSHLCQPAETVVFACAVKGQRTVSVCASKPLSTTKGLLQYRFGNAKQADMVLPKNADSSPDWQQVASRSLMFSGGGGAYLRFNNQTYAYVVYTATGRGWGEKTGLFVLKDGQTVSKLPCTGKQISIGRGAV